MNQRNGMENGEGSDRHVQSEIPPDAFETHDVVVAAESMHGAHTETIVRILDSVGSRISGILVELPVDLQPSVDSYIASGTVDATLEGFLEGAKKEGKNISGILRIFQKAKEISIAVRCIDSSKAPSDEYPTRSKYGSYYLRGSSRDEDMFVNIQREQEQAQGKFLVLVGANHAEPGDHPLTQDATLGQRLTDALGERVVTFVMQPDTKRHS